MRTAFAVLLVSAVLVASTPTALRAHDRLKSSNPAAGAHLSRAPQQIRLEFTEPAELTFTMIGLAKGGTPVPLGPLAFAPGSRHVVVAAIPGAIEAGTYAVTWQVAGTDGHPVRGSYEFVVAPGATGAASVDSMPASMHHDPVMMPEGSRFGAESAIYVLVRWVQFTALLLLVGAVSFRYLVLGTLERRWRAEDPAMRPFASEAAHRATGWGLVAATALALTLPSRLLAQSFAMHGARPFDASLVASMIRTTLWGKAWLLQLAGLVLLGVGFHLARSTSRNVLQVRAGTEPEFSRWWSVAAAGAIAAAFSLALSGMPPDRRRCAHWPSRRTVCT